MRFRWYYEKGQGSPKLQYLYDHYLAEWQDIEEVYDEGYFDHECTEHCPSPCPKEIKEK